MPGTPLWSAEITERDSRSTVPLSGELDLLAADLDFVLVGPTRPVRRLLEISGVYALLVPTGSATSSQA